MKKRDFVILILLFTTTIAGLCADKKAILFLPFANEGNYRLDRLKTHIPNYLYESVKGLPAYNAISYAALDAYMEKHNVSEADLKRYAVIESIGLFFKADYIFHGYFVDKDKLVTISFTIYKRIGNEYSAYHDLVSMKLEDLNAPALNASFESLIAVCEEVTDRKIERGHLTIVTNPSCRLFIDGEYIGPTPVRLALHPGGHRIRLTYDGLDEKETLFDESIEIRKDNPWEKRINVFVPLAITSEEKCTVFVNGEERGPTPFHEDLYWGREYAVKVVYYDERSRQRVVYDEVVDTRKNVPPLYISGKAELSLDFPGGFSADLGDEAPAQLPHTFRNIVPGDYRLRLLLDDPEWKRTWLYSDDTITLSPFEKAKLDRESVRFDPNWALLLVPSASQLNNREPVKAGIVLGSFLAAAAATAAFCGAWAYYDGEYNRMTGDLGDYTAMQIEDARVSRNGFFDLFIGGIVAAAAVYLYSGIDGAVTAIHLNELVNGK
jgi:hypothetical protein